MEKFYITLLACGSFFAIITLFGCSSTIEEKSPQHDLLIQLVLQSPALKSIKEELGSLVNKIVTEELDLKEENAPKFFSETKKNRLTLYYINDAYESGDSLLFSLLENERNRKLPANKISIKTEIGFFEGPFGDVQLSITINDPDQEIFLLHKDIKNVVQKADKLFKEKQGYHLYDINKSEKFDYVPHIGLGMVRSNRIKQNMKDNSKFDEAFKKIQKRIEIAALELIKKYASSKDDQKLSVEQLGILDQQKGNYVKIL